MSTNNVIRFNNLPVADEINNSDYLVIDNGIQTRRINFANFTVGPENIITGSGTGLGSTTSIVKNMSELKLVDVSNFTTGALVNVLGYYTTGDGGGGLFYYDSTSVLSQDNGIIFNSSSGSGRWIRLFSGAVNVLWFGAKGDGVTDSSAAIQSAINFVSTPNNNPNGKPGGSVFFPITPAGFLVSNTLVINASNVRLFGERQGHLSFTNSGGRANWTPDIRYVGTEAALYINTDGSATVGSFILENLWFYGASSLNSDTIGPGAYGLNLGNTGSSFKSAVGQIKNCVFSNFSTAAVKNYAVATLFIDNCEFKSNLTGIYTVDNNYTGRYTIRGCRFHYHTGAAFEDNHIGQTLIENSVFENNRKQAIKCVSSGLGGYLTIFGCDFEANCKDCIGSDGGTPEYWVHVTAGSINKLAFIANSFLNSPQTPPGGGSNYTNPLFYIATTTSGGNGFVDFISNVYTGTSTDKMGLAGTGGSNPIHIRAHGESNQYHTAWSLGSGSVVLTDNSYSYDSGAIGAPYVGCQLRSIKSGVATPYYEFYAAQALVMNNATQYRLNGSRAGASGYAAGTGSLCNNSAPTHGKHQFFACQTGSTVAASTQWVPVNASLCGWVPKSADVANTLDVSDTGQIRINNIANNIQYITSTTRSSSSSVEYEYGGQTLLITVISGIGSATLVNGTTGNGHIRTKSGANVTIASGQVVMLVSEYVGTTLRWLQV